MNKEFEDLTFSFDDFNDYKEEIEDIKAVYDDLMKDKAVQKMLKKRLKNNAKKELKTSYNIANEQLDNYSNDIIGSKKIEVKNLSNETKLETGYKLEKGLC